MTEYICLKCNTVFMGNSSSKCCGELEEFSAEKHGSLLISNSNSWIAIRSKWYGNPLFEEISQELANDGCYSASTHINVFIERLLERLNES